MFPVPRAQLKTVSYRNQSLQDILGTCTVGISVQSVQRTFEDVHNTRLVVLIDHGKFYPGTYRFEQRVQFYNRLKLEDILPKDFSPFDTVEENIHYLNMNGYDFNNDDLELMNGKLEAVRTSLGYYSDREGDDTLMWNADADVQMWSYFELDYMWIRSAQFPDEEMMVGDQVTERQFKAGFVEIMKSIQEKLDRSKLGAPAGIATLDQNGQINLDQVPITVYFSEPKW